jgi:hypothetical protein
MVPGYQWESFTWFLVTNENYSQEPFTWFLFTTIHVLHSFYTCSSAKNNQRTNKEQEEQLSFDHGALVSIHVFIIS